MARKAIRSEGWDGTYELRTKDNKPVVSGQKVKDFRDETVVIKGGSAPHKSDSEGYIYTKDDNRFYAGVCDLEWVKI